MALLLPCLLLLALCRAEYDIDDSTLYKIEWPGALAPPVPGLGLQPHEGSPSGSTEHSAEAPGGGAGLWAGEGEQVVMTSVDNEKFTCYLPKVLAASSSSSSSYSGPSVLGLLEQLFTQQSCAYRLESYWTYELCHGRFLRQYHEERQGKQIKLQEYSLGKFTKEMFDELVVEEKKDLEGGITRHPPTKKIEGLNLPYHEVTMSGGDLCDLNKQPRRTRVLYVCYPAGKNEVYSLKEVSTCEYEVVVLSAALCSHPSYKPEESTEYGISCRPLGDGPLKRQPSRLSQLEIEGLKLRSERMFEARLAEMNTPGIVKFEFQAIPVERAGHMVEIEGGEEVPEQEAREGQWKESVREPFKPLMDPAVVKEFLAGEYCLYGGSGWWKYEFCYGKKVDQYHEEGGGQRTVVRLGSFSEQEHLAWLEGHPGKRPKPREQRKQVSIFYSGGDLCDITGRPRQIEVKMKCKQADSPSTVSLYLLEPKTCEYVLGVESPLVCDILPHADDLTGLFPAGLLERIGEKPKEIDPKVGEKLELLKQKIAEQALREEKKLAEDVISRFSHTTTESSSTSRITQESVTIEDRVKTIVRKTIVDGVVVASTTEKIQLHEQEQPATEDVIFLPPDEVSYDEVDYDQEVVGVLADEQPPDVDYDDEHGDHEDDRLLPDNM